MEALRPLVLGQTLAGAGGGGFLYVLTREPRQREEVLRVLNDTPVRNGHDCVPENLTCGSGTGFMFQRLSVCSKNREEV